MNCAGLFVTNFPTAAAASALFGVSIGACNFSSLFPSLSFTSSLLFPSVSFLLPFASFVCKTYNNINWCLISSFWWDCCTHECHLCWEPWSGQHPRYPRPYVSLIFFLVGPCLFPVLLYFWPLVSSCVVSCISVFFTPDLDLTFYHAIITQNA